MIVVFFTASIAFIEKEQRRNVFIFNLATTVKCLGFEVELTWSRVNL